MAERPVVVVRSLGYCSVVADRRHGLAAEEVCPIRVAAVVEVFDQTSFTFLGLLELYLMTEKLAVQPPK